MIKRLRKINDALPGIILGNIFFGMVCQLLGVWFVADKAGYSIGLWSGIFTAILMAGHMAWSLDKAMDYGEDGAVKIMIKHYLLRDVYVAAVLAVMIYTKAGNLFTTFLGIMGLKVAAYLQPVTDKLLKKFPEKQTGKS